MAASEAVSVGERTLKMVFSKLVDGLKATDNIDELFEDRSLVNALENGERYYKRF